VVSIRKTGLCGSWQRVWWNPLPRAGSG